MPGHEPGEDACFRDSKLAWLGYPRSRLWWERKGSPYPFSGYEIFSPETFPQAEKASASSTELLPILQNPPPICQPKPAPLLPAPPVYRSTRTISNTLGREQASSPLVYLGPCSLSLDHRLRKNREQTSCISITSRTSCEGPSTWELLYEAKLN